MKGNLTKTIFIILLVFLANHCFANNIETACAYNFLNSSNMVDSSKNYTQEIGSNQYLLLTQNRNKKTFKYPLMSKIKLVYFDEKKQLVKASGTIRKIDSNQIVLVKSSLFKDSLDLFVVPVHQIKFVERKPLSVKILFPVSLTGPLVDIIIPVVSGLSVGAPSPWGIVTIGMAIYTIVMPSKREIGEKYSVQISE